MQETQETKVHELSRILARDARNLAAVDQGLRSQGFSDRRNTVTIRADLNCRLDIVGYIKT